MGIRAHGPPSGPVPGTRVRACGDTSRVDLRGSPWLIIDVPLAVVTFRGSTMTSFRRGSVAPSVSLFPPFALPAYLPFAGG